MCIEFPGRVLAVDEAGATILRGARHTRASTFLVPDVAPGDWVFVAAGTIIRRLDADEAAAITTTLRDAISRDTVARSAASSEMAPAAAGIGGSR